MEYLYFAYGSNLNLEQMQLRCPESRAVSPAVLRGWKLVERCYADVEKADNKCVNGALYVISKTDLAALDRYEGYPDFYTREEVQVTDQAGVYRKALVYTMSERYKNIREGLAYSDSYRAICSEGAECWGIPNAFSGRCPSRRTLFENGVPAVREGLKIMLDHLKSGEDLPAADRLWCGARVIISLKPREIPGDWGGFYPAPLVVSTPHGCELSWVFNDLKLLFQSNNILNSVNKFGFFQALGLAAEKAIEKNPRISAADLCREAVLAAQKIYEEKTE